MHEGIRVTIAAVCVHGHAILVEKANRCVANGIGKDHMQPARLEY